ncbi:hypothetical protein AAFF_G00383900 [Aldrovandia affinis]|uniref:Uncharacterized protein n=1 Tax=Aldrovandia affinis TaxID=143900 RepID=A0AAD7WLJ3_9TELE|nr:hypothetical protein AAFF_G00383900 [Aldrovandia affinis]
MYFLLSLCSHQPFLGPSHTAWSPPQKDILPAASSHSTVRAKEEVSSGDWHRSVLGPRCGVKSLLVPG